MTVRVVFNDDQAGPRFRETTGRRTKQVLAAARAAAEEAAREIEQRGRADIESAGNFGTRWTDGFTATVTEGGGFIKITVQHAVPYWTVFEFGATIQGKPLLWIPLSFAEDAKGIRARDFPEPLFRVDRLAGAPLLMSATTKEPKYFGKEQVTIPRKFHLRQICTEVAREIPEMYRDHFSKG